MDSLSAAVEMDQIFNFFLRFMGIWNSRKHSMNTWIFFYAGLLIFDPYINSIWFSSPHFPIHQYPSSFPSGSQCHWLWHVLFWGGISTWEPVYVGRGMTVTKTGKWSWSPQSRHRLSQYHTMGHSLRHFPENSLKLFYSGQLQFWGSMRGDCLVFLGQALHMFTNMNFIFGTLFLRKQINKYACLCERWSMGHTLIQNACLKIKVVPSSLSIHQV